MIAPPAAAAATNNGAAQPAAHATHPGPGAISRPATTPRAAESATTGGGFCAPATYLALPATPARSAAASSAKKPSPLKPATSPGSVTTPATTPTPAKPGATPDIAYPYALSGKVTKSGGVGLANVAIVVSMPGGFGISTYTQSNGTYSVNVPSGDVTICYDGSSVAGGPYLNGFYKPGSPGNLTGNVLSAGTVHVGVSSVGGIDVQLSVGLAISGTITGFGGALQVGMRVIAASPSYTATTWTSGAGVYRAVVPANELYTIRIDAIESSYLSGYYLAGAPGHFTLDRDSAGLVTVNAHDVAGIDIQLPVGKQISGTVTGTGATPVGGILVTAGSDSGFCLDACYAYTASNGYYVLVVPSDTFIISLDDLTGFYLNGYYSSGSGGHFNVDSTFASSVVVGSSNVSGVNVQLGTGVHIKGFVVNSGGFSLPGVNVTAFGTSGVGYCGSTTSGLDGSYSIDVPAGSYQVFFGGDCSGVTGVFSNGVIYQIGWYGPPWTVAVEWVDAATVTVGIVDITGISVHLLLPWSVSLTASATTVKNGTSVLVTATANQSVSPTPYYIVILNYDGSVVTNCSTGTTCLVGLLRSSPGSVTFHAVIADADGGNEQARSADLTITWVGSTYHPIAPVRMLDTRNGTGLVGKLTANTPRTFQVAGRLGIPANASAVTGNVTVVGSSAGWAVYLGPAPVASPTTSTINFTAGQVAGNGLTVALSGTGYLSATYISSGANTTDLVFDVTGYFTSDGTGQTYHPMNPVRELDSRSGNGLSGKFVASTPRTFTVAGRNGVPANAKAVTGNITVVGSTAGWAAYLGPAPIAAPTTSTVNFTAGQTMGNNLTVALSGAGTLSATYMGPGGATTDIVFDVTGYYTADATGAVFAPITPARVLDTRNGTGLSGTLTAATPRTLAVSGHGGVPSGAVAVTGNVTVVNESAGWAVFLGPVATPAPTTSTVNFLVGDVKGNGLNVALSGTGTLSATYISSPGNTTDLVFDVTGYYLI